MIILLFKYEYLNEFNMLWLFPCYYVITDMLKWALYFERNVKNLQLNPHVFSKAEIKTMQQQTSPNLRYCVLATKSV